MPQPTADSLVTVTVQTVTDFGAFVAVEGTTTPGLILIPEITWGRCRHPSEHLETGHTYTMKVLGHVPETDRIMLSLKRLTPDPWEVLGERLCVGARFNGTVV